MAKFVVNAQVTVFHEIVVTADDEEEAVEVFKKELEDQYGWVDFDTVYVNDKQM